MAGVANDKNIAVLLRYFHGLPLDFIDSTNPKVNAKGTASHGSLRGEGKVEILEAIHTRRSIRKYLDRPVPEELIQKLLAAAMQAPSARNQQPWQFVVIDDRAILAEIPTFMPNAAMAAQGPAGDPGLRRPEPGEVRGLLGGRLCGGRREHAPGGACLGPGAVWCGVYPRDQRMEGLRQLIGLPKNVIAHSLVVLGYAAEQVPAEDRYRPERVHHNRWPQKGG